MRRVASFLLLAQACLVLGAGCQKDNSGNSSSSGLESRDRDAAIQDGGNRSPSAVEAYERCEARDMSECTVDGDCVVAMAQQLDSEGDCFLSEREAIGCVPAFPGGALISCAEDTEGNRWYLTGGQVLPTGWSYLDGPNGGCGDTPICP